MTYTQAWDAENRLTAVTNTTTLSVTKFIYDGDGARVLQVALTGTQVLTTAYASALEVQITSTQRITKTYYRAGSTLIAMRVYTAPNSSVVYFLAGDHLGSTSLTLNATGSKIGEMKYYPYGETRYSWGSTPTDRRFTGQRQEDAAALGSLYDYGARSYSPLVGRFLSADTIVPKPENPQSLNRFSYTRNNPLKRIDPSGNRDLDCISYQEACDLPTKMRQRILASKYEVTVSDELGNQAIDAVYFGAAAFAWKLAQNSGIGAAQTFLNVFDPITMGHNDYWSYCGAPSSTSFECSEGGYVTERTVVHELSHMFNKRHSDAWLSDNLETTGAIVAEDGTQIAGQVCNGSVCNYKRTALGYVDTIYPGLQHGTSWDDFEQGSSTSSAPSEDFADMMLNWVYEDNYDDTGYGQLRSQWFDALMVSEGIWNK